MFCVCVYTFVCIRKCTSESGVEWSLCVLEVSVWALGMCVVGHCVYVYTLGVSSSR